MNSSRKSRNHEFGRLWDNMGLVEQRAVAGEMRIITVVNDALVSARRALHRPVQRTWYFASLQPAIIGAIGTGDTQPMPGTR